MLDGSAGRKPYDTWLPNERYIDFVRLCFSRNDGSHSRKSEALSERNSMKAWELKVKGGMTFVGTNNLVRHLELDLDGRNFTFSTIHHFSGPNSH